MTNGIELDVRTLSNGPIVKYFNLDLWDRHLAWFEEKGYKRYRFDASEWQNIENFYSDTHQEFEFPNYFGRNWDAFFDCITDIDFGERVLITVTNFDCWYRGDYRSSVMFLDMMAQLTYRSLVRNQRLITLIQSNQPTLDLRDVGAQTVYWNHDEWSCSDRVVQ